MVSEQALSLKTKSLKNLLVKPLKVDETGRVEAFVAMYNKMGIGDRLSMGLKEVNELWDQSSSKRPKNYWVIGDLFDNEGHVGASCFVSEEYLDNTRKEQKEAEKAKWREICEEWASR